MNNEKEKGISIYMALIIMMFFLTMVLGLTAILLNQLKISAGLSNSVQAFYAADTGIEQALANPDLCDLNNPCEGTLFADEKGQAVYSVQRLSTEYCSEPVPKEYCIKSVGSYADTTRAIEVKQ